MSHAIRVDQEVYDALLALAQEREREEGRRVSMAEAARIALERS